MRQYDKAKSAFTEVAYPRGYEAGDEQLRRLATLRDDFDCELIRLRHIFRNDERDRKESSYL